jgi:hypothetical protein
VPHQPDYAQLQFHACLVLPQELHLVHQKLPFVVLPVPRALPVPQRLLLLAPQPHVRHPVPHHFVHVPLSVLLLSKKNNYRFLPRNKSLCAALKPAM